LSNWRLLKKVLVQGCFGGGEDYFATLSVAKVGFWMNNELESI
jgi:hypothetical protein